jgi:hypothetical protein
MMRSGKTTDSFFRPQEYRSHFETLLMELTRHELKDAAEFFSDYSFKLRQSIVDRLKMVHVYHHNGIGLPDGLPRQVGNKLVKRVAVPYAGQGVNLEIGFEDKKVTVQQR